MESVKSIYNICILARATRYYLVDNAIIISCKSVATTEQMTIEWFWNCSEIRKSPQNIFHSPITQAWQIYNLRMHMYVDVMNND